MGRRPVGQGKTVDEGRYPNVNGFLHRPLLNDPPLCTLKELQDGTYSLEDVFLMHELLDLKSELKGG